MTERTPPAAKRRRKPVQARSWQTSLAIQEAFVRLLVESEYEKIKIRDIVMVAGVGLGTFYEYFTSKEELARTCVHLRSKQFLQTLERCRAEVAGQPLAQGIAAVVEAMVHMIEQAPAQWGQHFLLERRHTALAQYRADYERFTAQWQALLAAAGDWPAGRDAAAPALMVFTQVYGVLAHTALAADAHTDFAAVRAQLRLATLGYLAAWAQDA